ncbi:MAG: hypothetical protein QMB65_12260, partial [Vicingaceae bacterium]
LVINYFDLPDYMVEVSAITFSPLVVTSDIDSFDVKILVTNLGRAIDTSIVVELIRDYPESSFSDTTYTRVIVGPNYQESISIRLPVDVVKGLGINTFTVEVDLPSFVDESYDISNNSIIQTLNILSGEIIPVYPYEFMIVPDTLQYAITLKASTAFAFEPAKDYIFEIDTTDYFNSPIKQSTTINSAGGIVEWTPSIYSNFPVNKDSVVYFWRVSKDSVNAKGYSWRERSFQRILAKEGWQQDHFFQFKNDEYQFVNHNRSIRQFEFVNDLKDLKVTNQGKADLSELNDVGYFMNGDVLGSNAYDVPTSIHVAVLDSITLEPWSAEQLNLGQTNIPGTNSGGPYENYFVFRHNPTQMVALESFLNAVPNGNHIIMWSCYILNLASFTTPMPVSLRSNIGLMGGSQISAITDLYPFIFYHQKGNLASTAEVVGNSISEKGLIFNKTLFTSANYGNIFSETFGPATSWDSLSWRMSSIEMPSTKDVSVLNVYGIDASGNETLIPSLSNLPTDSG